MVGEFLNSLRIILNFNEKINKKSLLTNSYVVCKLQTRGKEVFIVSQYTGDLYILSNMKWDCSKS